MNYLPRPIGAPLADYQAYVGAQDAAERAYRDRDAWTRMSILNTARCSFFSSDRAIRQYCDAIWAVQPVDVAATAARTADGGGPSRPTAGASPR